MLSRVKIQNFKSIGEPGVDLELKPLTFLVGPNGGGKSNVLDAIVFASHGGISRPEFFSFSNYEDIHFRRENNILSVYVEVEDSDSEMVGGHTFLHENFKQNPSPQTPESISSSFIGKVFPIRATRGIIEDSDVPKEADWVWQNGEHTLEILERLPDANYRSERMKIQKWVSVFGISEAAATLAGRSRISGSFSDEILDVALNASFASTGSRQVLPLIIQLFWSNPGSIILIEEPEISLHPELQIRLLEMFAEAINESKQIILTTHSHFLLQAIGYAVHNKWMKADQISVYHVEKGENGTEVESLALGKNGYIQGWVPSFNKVERRLLKEWAETLPRE